MSVVGCRRIEAGVVQTAEPFPMLAMYPARGQEQAVQFGPFTMQGALDAPIAEGRFPLVVISHGSGGSQFVYRTLAAHLARTGFVVLTPEHPRNNRHDNSLAGTDTILASRPRHIRSVIDWATSADGFGASLQQGAVAVVGHSLGGYTALALAGGQPMAFPNETPDGIAKPVGVTSDARVRALVLLAPATPWFMDSTALRAVHIPILMLTAEHDPQTPAWHGDIVLRGVGDPSAITHRVVPNAGHYSFLSPFPAAMTNAGFAPSQDPPGFDRDAFQVEMQDEIVAFLRRVL